jgi:hypothetical protein
MTQDVGIGARETWSGSGTSFALRLGSACGLSASSIRSRACAVPRQ